MAARTKTPAQKQLTAAQIAERIKKVASDFRELVGDGKKVAPLTQLVIPNPALGVMRETVDESLKDLADDLDRFVQASEESMSLVLAKEAAAAAASSEGSEENPSGEPESSEAEPEKAAA